MTRLTFLIALLLTLHGIADAQTLKPKLRALVIGVENYDADQLDLNYAADDARKVYAQLEVIAELESSRLIVADREGNSKQSESAISASIQRFADSIKDNETVVVYIGGHGTLSPNKKPWFLPSDFEPQTRVNALPVSDIFRYFHEAVAGGPLTGVRVVFFLNICGAGNATLADLSQPIMDAESEKARIDGLRDGYLEYKFGEMDVALIPATARDKNTFEDTKELKSSVFAHHLLEALKGRAAGSDNQITTAEILTYVRANLGEAIPTNADFKGDLSIGVTGQLDGEASFLLGTSLLAAAEAIAARADGDASGEVTAHLRALRDLADGRFAAVEARHPDLWPRANLRRQLAALAWGGDAPDLSSLIGAESLGPAERSLVKSIADPDRPAPRLLTLRSLRDALASDPRSILVVVTDDGSKWMQNRGPALEIPEGAASTVKRLTLSSVSPSPAREAELQALLDTIDELRRVDQPQRDAGKGVAPLVVFYGGRAALEPFDACSRESQSETCRVKPIGAEELNRIRKIWEGPFVYVHSAPFGGHLIAYTAREVSLLLAAREPNGMTFSDGKVSSADILLAAMFSGLPDTDALQPLSDFHALMASRMGESDYIAGSPAWLPATRSLGRSEYDQAARDHFAPLGAWALQVKAGCGTRPLDECAAIAAPSGDLQAGLAAAATSDLDRHSGEAATAYRRFAADLASGPATAADELGARGADAALTEFGGLALRRASGVESKVGRRVVILPVAVEDYLSPFVGDVPHAVADVEAYAAAIKVALAPRGAAGSAAIETEVEVRPVVTPANANAFLAALRQARDIVASRPQDLLILVWSGRGYEYAGRRYLVMEGADLSEGADPMPVLQDNESFYRSSSGYVEVGRNATVDLGTIADEMKGNWFVGIYDTQFARSDSDQWRIERILDKNIDAVLAEPQQPFGLPAPPPPPLTDPQRFDRVTAPRGALPPQQVHLWIEGRLTQGSVASVSCSSDIGDEGVPAVASPLAGAVAAALLDQNQTTYRAWGRLISASPCLRDMGLPIMQGDLDLPLFASGKGAEFVAWFRDGSAQGDVNLRASLAVAHDVRTRFPAVGNRLATAAILIALAQLHADAAELHGFDDDRALWLDEASRALESMSDDALMGGGEDLRPLQRELLARALILQGHPEQARDVLLAAPSEVLARRGLALRLVRIADQVLNREPAVVLGSVSRALAKLSMGTGAAASAGDAGAALDTLITRERARRAEPYRITPPSSAFSEPVRSLQSPAR